MSASEIIRLMVCVGSMAPSMPPLQLHSSPPFTPKGLPKTRHHPPAAGGGVLWRFPGWCWPLQTPKSLFVFGDRWSNGNNGAARATSPKPTSCVAKTTKIWAAPPPATVVDVVIDMTSPEPIIITIGFTKLCVAILLVTGCGTVYVPSYVHDL